MRLLKLVTSFGKTLGQGQDDDSGDKPATSTVKEGSEKAPVTQNLDHICDEKGHVFEKWKITHEFYGVNGASISQKRRCIQCGLTQIDHKFK